MTCPFCGSNDNKVWQSDDSVDLTFKRRGRLCLKCRVVFETIEQPTNNDYFKRGKGTYLESVKFKDLTLFDDNE